MALVTVIKKNTSCFWEGNRQENWGSPNRGNRLQVWDIFNLFTLAWKIPWMEEPGRLQSMGSLSRTWLSDFTFTFHFHALEKEMAAIHSSTLVWKTPWMEEPDGLQSMGSQRVGHDWATSLSLSQVKVLGLSHEQRIGWGSPFNSLP